MMEFEFITSGHSFPRDLGWNMKSYTTHLFSCIYSSNWPDSPAGSMYCEITAGTTEDSVFVRVKGFTGIVTSGVSRWIWLSNVKNAEFAGFVPSLVVRTKDSTGVMMQEQSFDLPILVDLPTALTTATVAPSSIVLDVANPETDFSLPITASLANSGEIFFVFPHGYK